MNGFRQQPVNSKKERFKTMETEMKNSQTALRLSQLMIQQLHKNAEAMGSDMSRLFQLVTELQYKILAMQSLGNFDTKQLSDQVNELRLKDFNEASDKEDTKNNFTPIDIVEEDSTVIISSTTPGVTPDAGIFRSRIKLAECGVPELINGLNGKPVGTKITVKLNNVDHEVELLAVRKPAPSVTLEVSPDQVVNQRCDECGADENCSGNCQAGAAYIAQ